MPFKHTAYTYARYIILVANSLRQKPVSDFPGKNWGAFAFVDGNFVDHLWGGHSGFAATNGPGSNRPGLIVAAQYFGYTAVGHLKDPGYVTGSCTTVSELYNPLPGRIRQRTSVDEHAAELVDTTVPCNDRNKHVCLISSLYYKELMTLWCWYYH